MAQNNENILEQARKRGLATPSAGMTVPEGYFASFAERMSSQLPERPEIEQEAKIVVPKTTWEKVRTYVYMAAMFAGIWLMLQMVTLIVGQSNLTPIDSNPILASALSNDDFMFDYLYDDISTGEYLDEMLYDDNMPEDFDFESIFTSEPNDDNNYILP